jgi:TfoX/Sxy family transcriptional regulator of competence genes
MASDEKFMAFVRDQLRDSRDISYRKMFGEYAIYKGRKVVALVCDNQLFVKPTPGGKALLDPPREAQPFPGAKPWYVISDALDDAESLSHLIAVTARDLPEPPPKKPKSKKKAARPK